MAGLKKPMLFFLSGHLGTGVCIGACIGGLALGVNLTPSVPPIGLMIAAASSAGLYVIGRVKILTIMDNHKHGNLK